jgi:hypothetical protein
MERDTGHGRWSSVVAARRMRRTSAVPLSHPCAQYRWRLFMKRDRYWARQMVVGRRGASYEAHERLSCG